MKRLIPILLLAACTPAQERRAPDPRALHGLTLGLPVPADARPTPGIGCGQISQDLPLRAHKALVAAFSDAGEETERKSGPGAPGHCHSIGILMMGTVCHRPGSATSGWTRESGWPVPQVHSPEPHPGYCGIMSAERCSVRGPDTSMEM